MQNEQVKVVKLKPSHPEYTAVEKMFATTCPDFTIEKVISYGVGRGKMSMLGQETLIHFLNIC